MKLTLTMASAIALAALAFASKNDPAYHRARIKGAMAEIRLVVHDEVGEPVSNASVCASFEMPDEPYSLYGRTDSNGVWVVRGKTDGSCITFFVGKEGYYGTTSKMTFAKMGAQHDVRHGKWQPFGAEEVVVLKRILSPITILTTGKGHDIPYTNRWFGFDLVDMDLLTPFGNGKINDVEFIFDWDGKFRTRSDFQRLKVRFPNNLDGAYFKAVEPFSRFPYSYHASDSAHYQKEFCFSRITKGGKTITYRPDKGNEIVFRIRCNTNNIGELVSCQYGRIRGLDFSGGTDGGGRLFLFRDLNPSANDPNLEDDEFIINSRKFIEMCEED